MSKIYKDSYRFIAVFHFADDGISISFPDLPGCLPCADTEEEALKNARESLGLHLWGLEQDGEPIPAPSSLKNVKLDAGDIKFDSLEELKAQLEKDRCTVNNLL